MSDRQQLVSTGEIFVVIGDAYRVGDHTAKDLPPAWYYQRWPTDVTCPMPTQQQGSA